MRKSTKERMAFACAFAPSGSLMGLGGGEIEDLVLLSGPVRFPFLSVFSFRWSTEETGDPVNGRVPPRRKAEAFRRLVEIAKAV